MIGTIINACAILVGSSIGSVIKRGLKPKYQDAIFTAVGIATIGLGLNATLQNMPNSSYPVLFIVSMALGAVIGTALNLEGRFKKSRLHTCKERHRVRSGPFYGNNAFLYWNSFDSWPYQQRALW